MVSTTKRQNQGWVSVGVDHDTAQLAVEAIRQWWWLLGKQLYPQAIELLITADCCGFNSYRARLWKWELQQLATELGLILHVCHFPPGTSKWNKPIASAILSNHFSSGEADR